MGPLGWPKARWRSAGLKLDGDLPVYWPIPRGDPQCAERATIASQLNNSREPITLFELQAGLGHHSRETTQHYARITPTTLAKAYSDAGYFARNVRTVEVFI